MELDLSPVMIYLPKTNKKALGCQKTNNEENSFLFLFFLALVTEIVLFTLKKLFNSNIDVEALMIP